MELLAAARVGCFLLLLLEASVAQTVVRTTVLGKVRGAVCGNGDNGVASFLGIPYAQPPVGSLRWKAPTKYIRPYPAVGLNATAPGSSCRQGNEGDEDCLYLNVWAPANIAGLRTKLPVRVFIHGGAYQTGSGSDGMYDGCKLVKDGDVVFVTMNYRLGILGYLALPELRDPQANLTVGNWGLLDQRLALQWVRDNIGAFGGDPKKVVLSGESAGAYSTLLHLVAPGSKGLFSAAASFSGSADAMAVDFLRDAYRKGSTLRTTLNCSSSNALARGYASTGDCLRAVDADTLLAVQDEISSRTVDSFIPTIDGIFMPRHPVRLMQLGNATKVPVLLGVNANEGALEVLGQTRGLDPIDVEGFFTVVNSLIPISPSFNERLYQQYNADEYYGGSWLLSAINVITDGGYHCPSRRVAKLLSAQGLTVRYHILQASKPNTGCPLFVTTGLFFGEEFTNFMDAFHSYDIPFTFLAPYRYPFNQCPFTPNETQLASYLSGIINAMAATGSPLPPRTSSLTSRLLKNTPSWKPWTATSNPVMNIDTAGPRVFEAADLLLDAKCQFWDDLLNADITAGTAFHS